jgi:hypothetical protein
MKSNNPFEEQICDVTRITGFLAWDKMYHHGKPIHYHKDRINTSLRPYQSQYEIHAYRLPWPLWYGQRLIETCILLPSLGMLENSASIYKPLNL